MIKLSTFRTAANTNRKAYEAMNTPGELNAKERVAMTEAIETANEAAYALFAECGIDRKTPDSPERYRLQARILRAVNHASHVDWSV